jgi:uncharacterized membrane protein YdbT with pleckstrin-like domain
MLFEELFSRILVPGVLALACAILIVFMLAWVITDTVLLIRFCMNCKKEGKGGEVRKPVF